MKDYGLGDSGGLVYIQEQVCIFRNNCKVVSLMNVFHFTIKFFSVFFVIDETKLL